ncbi:hypothetical protein O1W69_04130 [Chlamydia sp. 12-01]
MKWFLSILVFSSPALLIPGCTLIPKEWDCPCSHHQQESISQVK